MPYYYVYFDLWSGTSGLIKYVARTLTEPFNVWFYYSGSSCFHLCKILLFHRSWAITYGLDHRAIIHQWIRTSLLVGLQSYLLYTGLDKNIHMATFRIDAELYIQMSMLCSPRKYESVPNQAQDATKSSGVYQFLVPREEPAVAASERMEFFLSSPFIPNDLLYSRISHCSYIKGNRQTSNTCPSIEQTQNLEPCALPASSRLLRSLGWCRSVGVVHVTCFLIGHRCIDY